jgi:esterase/lipase superfamily enzyme
MQRAYHTWFSHRVRRDMELLVFGHAGDRVLVFPTRQGRFYDYEDWGLVDAVRDRIEAGRLQLFCVDSYDSQSLYDWGIAPWERIARHRDFEEYVLCEVLPLTRAINPEGALVAHGCSIGAYHAVNIAFRHPSLFRKVIGFSGRYDLTHAYAWYRDLFSGHYDETIYFNMPNHFIPNVWDERLLRELRALDIRLVVGEADYFVESNRQLSRALWDKGIWHAFDVVPERAAHAPRYWREMAARHLT